MHSSETHAQAIFAAVGLGKESVFYELGSGDGRLVRLARKMGATRAVGFELVFWVHYYAKLVSWAKGVRVELKHTDFLQAQWSEATVVYAYLFPELLDAVVAKFYAECPTGAVLICKDFQAPSFAPDSVMEFESPHKAYIYVRTERLIA